MFWWCGGLALSRHSHLLPERPISVLANNYLPSRFIRSYHTASVAPRLRTPPPHPKTFLIRCRLSGCHPWRFIQFQALATYQMDVTRTSCCGLHLYYASSPRPAVSLSCGESCVYGSWLPARQLSFVLSAPTPCQCCPFSRRSRSRAGILSHRPDRTR